jgi:hypothetical protein
MALFYMRRIDSTARLLEIEDLMTACGVFHELDTLMRGECTMHVAVATDSESRPLAVLPVYAGRGLAATNGAIALSPRGEMVFGDLFSKAAAALGLPVLVASELPLHKAVSARGETVMRGAGVEYALAPSHKQLWSATAGVWTDRRGNVVCAPLWPGENAFVADLRPATLEDTAAPRALEEQLYVCVAFEDELAGRGEGVIEVALA